MGRAPDTASTELALDSALVGVGVDVLARGRVSPRLAARRFTAGEQALFAASRDVPFAAREAVIKAVGGAGILGAPLREMPVAWEGGRLVFSPGPRYRAIMAARGVTAARLLVIAADDDHVIVACLALGARADVRARIAWALVANASADAAALAPEELAFARTRPDPSASIATRNAAHLAARALGLPRGVRVEGGGDRPPRLAGAHGALLSLAHEDTLAVALVAVVVAPVDAPRLLGP